MENSLAAKQEPSKPKLPIPAWLKVLAAVCFALVVVGLPYLDLARAKSTQSADFLACHYVAAKLIATGQANLLYPSATSTSIHNAAFNQAAHQILPWMHATLQFDEFLYMPLVPRIFLPVSYLEPNIALLCWQAISLVAFLCGTWLVAFRKESKGDVWTLLLPFTFFPVLHTFWQGNVSLVCAYLPFAISFYLLQQRKPFWAGFVLSLTVLKTQFMLTAGLIGLTELFGKRLRLVFGLAAGVVLFSLLTIWICGIDQCSDWLHCMKGSDSLYIDRRIAERFAIGLPRTVATLLQLSSELRTKVYLLCALLAVPPLVLAFRLERTALPDTCKIALKYVLLCTLPPLIVPHFFYYDLNLYVLAGVLLLTAQVPEELSEMMKPHIYFLWFASNLYFILAIRIPAYAQPLILDAIIFVFACRLWHTVGKLSTKAADSG